MEDIKETFYHTVAPLDFGYNYRVGTYLQRYIDALKDKKILGAKCPQCGKVVVPPRKYCGACNKVREEYVELSQEGTLENYTVGHITLEKGQVNQAESPYIVGMIKLGGADNLLVGKVAGVSPQEVKTGMRLKAVWKDQTEGEYSDLDHFEPV
ncbi:MAG: Zn-ribbon domain-containing OB-fold protein [Actinobacteria bacterium]|nr:MAG: Zn-ribbon domain-containing OB-fold protein [Actinomycetota bacterium]